MAALMDGELRKSLLDRTDSEKAFRPWWDTLEDTLLNTLIALGKNVIFFILKMTILTKFSVSPWFSFLLFLTETTAWFINSILYQNVSSHRRYIQIFLNPEFQLSMTKGSRVVEKGFGSTFEECHALLSCKTINKI